MAPGKARGHVVYSQDKTQHAAGPAAYHGTESDGYPHSARGLASPGARRILLRAPGPFDGLAMSPGAMACGWRVSYSLDAPAWRRQPFICQLDRDGCWANERQAMATVLGGGSDQCLALPQVAGGTDLPLEGKHLGELCVDLGATAGRY